MCIDLESDKMKNRFLVWYYSWGEALSQIVIVLLLVLMATVALVG